MLGSPLYRIFVVLGILLLAAVGIVSLTDKPYEDSRGAAASSRELASHPSQPSAPPASKPPASPTPPPAPVKGTLRVDVDSPIAPSSLRLTAPSTSLLLEKREPSQSISLQSAFAYPPAGCDLLVSAKWGDYLNGPRALRIKVFFNGSQVGEETFWGENETLEGSWHLPRLPQKPL